MVRDPRSTLLPKTHGGSADEGSDAAKAISQISPDLIKVAYGKRPAIVVMQRQE